MSIAAIRWAWDQRVCASVKLVLLALADHADKSGHCWPSLARLQARTGLARSTVADALRKLEDAELIERDRSAGGSTHATKYQLQQSAQRTIQQSDRRTIPEPNSPTGGLQQSAGRTRTVRQADPNHKEPSLNLKTLRKRSAQVEHPLFAQWYARYPLKKARGQAAKAFAKIDPDADLAKRMTEAIEEQKADRERKTQSGQWAPEWKHPATWLNGRCWEDETGPGPNAKAYLVASEEPY
jgi:DNA-binding transcriptional regulator YhcF (GntR family)